MKPRSEALAFRIWALCNPRGWGMTFQDCADELGENWHRVRKVAQLRGWSGRFKTIAPHRSDSGGRRAIPGGYADMIETVQHIAGLDRPGLDE